jgi:hypothetical protein
MLKALVLASSLLTQAAVAQDAPLPRESRVPTVENVKRPVAVPKYCVYEDKKYSEGAIKTVDGRTMICMAEDGVVFSSQQERNLEWVSGDLYRGQLYLKPASLPKR